MKNRLAIICAFAVVFGAWVATPSVVALLVTEPTLRGPFGDMFGAVNSLFTGLGFIGLIWTIFQQQEQVAMQRDELRLQREELKAQRDEMAASRTELSKQAVATRSLALATGLQTLAEATKLELEAEHLAVEDKHSGRFSNQIARMKVAAAALKELHDSLERELLQESSPWSKVPARPELKQSPSDDSR
jgi:hypothetical protein